MGKREAMGRKQETRNANRMGGRVDAYLTIDIPTCPHRMRTTTATQEKADAWLLEAPYLASQGAVAGLAYDSEGLTIAELRRAGRHLADRRVGISPGLW